MKIKTVKKSMLSVVITLSTASVYYAQQVKDSLKSKEIEQVVIAGVADIAKDRKTPVAVSTIKEAQIVERLGNQEFPEILNTTPSVYATKGGGGFGDGTIRIRGFENANIAVMINGVPVNDMEGGTVYWSNWAGLSDVTSAMQVQRGLGASKLAIASVGGTINVITRSSDKKQGANVTVGVGNNGYLKSSFSINTGKSAKGWSTSFLMARAAGSMYFDGSKFESYNYYFAQGYQHGNHDFQFTFTGAPQWHNQNFANTIATDILYGKDGEPNRKYNSNWGYLNGQEYSQTTNYYSKPVMSLNWDWKISDKSKLNSVVYASFGRGGGTGILGAINGKSVNSLPKTADGLIRWDDITKWNQGGTVTDFGANRTNPNGTLINTSSIGITQRSNINSHNWYGILSTFNHKFNDNLNASIGIDTRYYYGFHPAVAINFFGANGYFEKGNQNQQPGYLVTSYSSASPSANPFAQAVKDKSQILNRNYNGEVLWYGGFGQLEYSKNNLSAFVSGALSNQSYQRIDNWVVDGVSLLNGTLSGTPATNLPTASNPLVYTKTGMKSLMGYNAKGGLNYNIDEHSNVFGNVGYIAKQPFLTTVYPNNKQQLNPNLTNEKIFSVEFGYGYKSKSLKVNLNAFSTTWKDRAFSTNQTFLIYNSTTNVYSNLSGYAYLQGVSEIHKGVELEVDYKIAQKITLNGAFSYGNYQYLGNAQSTTTDLNNNPIYLSDPTNNTSTIYLDKVKVGNSAQTMASGGVTVKPVKDLSVYGNFRYYANLYSSLSAQNFLTTTAQDLGTLKLPDYGLLDLGLFYKLPIKFNNSKQGISFTGNVYNVLDRTYISEGTSNIINGLSLAQYSKINFLNPTAAATLTRYSSYVSAGSYNGVNKQNSAYFGFGRTWSASMTFTF